MMTNPTPIFWVFACAVVLIFAVIVKMYRKNLKAKAPREPKIEMY